MIAIEARGIVKRYGAVRAVDGVSLQVSAGEVFGLLGPNGAGKSTTAEILCGLLRADRGEVRILGYDIRRDAAAVRQRIGIQLQATTLFQRLTVRETIASFGGFYRRAAAPAAVLSQVQLEDKSACRVGELSAGQRQRLALGLALVNEPEVVLLDEPTTGLDPQVRVQIWRVIEDLRRRGVTVLLTTHYMEEAERLCDRVVLMAGGRIVAEGPPRQLVREHFQVAAIRFGPVSLPVDELRRLPAASSVSHDEVGVVVYSSRTLETIPAIIALAARHGADLTDLHVRTASLEDVVLKLTAHPGAQQRRGTSS